MAANSAIEWTTHTWNPWWGCTRVSEACRHCYAETLAKRYGFGWGPTARRRFFGEKHWQEPLKWNRQADGAAERPRVFCASMADVFEWLGADHPDCEEQVRARYRLWRLIEETPHLDWLLLTKRPENVNGEGADPSAGVALRWLTKGFPPNVWVGTTVEDLPSLKRACDLAKIPAQVRFLSCEPLLADLASELSHVTISIPWAGGQSRGGRDYSMLISCFHWIIVGGESGHGARPMHPEWVRRMRDLCQWHRIPFHFKQWGEHIPQSQLPAGWSMPWRGGEPTHQTHVWSEAPGDYSVRVGKKAAGRLLDGRTWDEMPTL